MALPRVAPLALLLLLVGAPFPGVLSSARIADAASGDTEAPFVTGYDFSALEVPQGGSVTITFDVEDASQVRQVGFTLKRDGSEHYVWGSYSNGASFPPGRYNVTLQWRAQSLPGNYSVYSIYTEDSNGNQGYWYAPDIPEGPAVTHGDTSQPVDLDAPVVESISFPETVEMGSTMTATVRVTDAAPISYVYLALVREGGSQAAYGYLSNETGLASGDHNVTVRWDYDMPGNYSLNYVSVGDVHENRRTYYSETLPNGSRRVAYGDVNATVDDDAPLLSNVTFNERTFRAGEQLVVTFDVADESNVSWASFSFSNLNSSSWFVASFEAWPPVPSGTYQARLNLTEGMAPGTYELQYGYANDEHGNQGYLSAPFPNGTPTSFTLVAEEEAAPDLVIAHVQEPASPTAGQQVAMNVTVRNDGTAPSGSNASLALIVNGTTVHTHGLISLGPGENFTARLTWNTTSAGTYNLTVFADSKERVNESREDNNRYTFLLTVNSAAAPKPDLTLDLNWVSPVVDEGATVALSAYVRNAGNASAPVTVHFFVDGNLFARVNGSVLTPGANTTVRANWTASGPGDHTLTAVVDREGLVNETREDNNADHLSVLVVPRVVADLGVEIVDVRRVRLETDFGSPGTNPIARRTVVVNVTHHDGASVAAGSLVVFARENLLGVVSEQTLAHVSFGNLTLGETRTFELAWDVLGTVGDVELVAYVFPFGDDPAPANNEDRRQDWVLVGGLGVGVGP